MSNVGPGDFASIFGQAPSPGDFSGPMSPPPPPGASQVPYGDPDGIGGQPKYDYRANRRVFLIYRPWQYCDRCRDGIAKGSIILPDEGDIECQHTMVGEYQDVMDDILKGKVLLGSETEITNKDGSVAVSLRWYSPVPKSATRAAP
jgi:hypothetical protein